MNWRGIPEEFRNQIVTGDARKLAKRIPDESIDLIFTDPVYDRIDDYRWLAETAARVLRPGGDVLTYLGAYHMGPIIKAMLEFLDWRWLLNEKKMTNGSLIWSYDLFSHTVPILWFTKGKPRKGPQRIDFMWSQGEGNGVNHKWAKGVRRIAYWLAKFGQDGDIVLDPYCGGGAIISACKMLGRNYIAFEIDPATAERARERVALTQPPLFVLQPEQAELAL
jgi:DNA modification methylase